jgi:endoglucanase
MRWTRPRLVLAAAAVVAVVVAGSGFALARSGGNEGNDRGTRPVDATAASPGPSFATVNPPPDASSAPVSTPSRSAAGTVAAAGGAAPAGTPVAANGRLTVCGVHLCNRAGRPIQLHGMSSHGLQFFPACLNRASLTALRTDWHADLIRVAMYVQEGGFETDPAGFTRKVNDAVQLATALGLYVIIDFHLLTPGDPTVNLARAKSFFADVAATHANQPNVIYEIANEPNGVSWATIKRYAEQVIPVIRARDPNSLILVGTRGFSSLGVAEGGNETETINDPVNAANIMYTFHFYAASHKDQQRATLARAAQRLPMFVSEFGTQTFTGTGANDLASASTWLDLLKSLGVSYAMWSFSDGAETNSVFVRGTCTTTNYAGTAVLTESGRFIRTRIRAANPA